MTPRLPTCSAKQVVTALKRAGFAEHAHEGSHLVLKNPETKMRTVVPMHAGDIGRGLLKKIIKQAGLTEDEFRELL
jgi:predicted RNA binding protein YcfA (HicA-like mRNA interferase family)